MRRRATAPVAFLFALASTLAAPARATTPPEGNVVIDRIELTGVRAVGQDAVLAGLQVGVGERLDRGRIVRSAEALQALYRREGYERVRIETRLRREVGESGRLESVLEFAIQEGDPTRLRSLTVEWADPAAAERLGLPALTERLLSRARFPVGSVVTAERLADARRGLSEELAARDFVGTRVDDPVLRDVPAPADATSAAGRWVDAVARVEPGERVSFGFRFSDDRAVHELSGPQLHGLVDELRRAGLGQDYAAQIRARIEREYRALGRADARIEVFPQERPGEERHYTFLVDEGPRFELGEVRFDGNFVFARAELEDRYAALSGPGSARRIFVESELEQGADRLIDWVKSRGYLGAKRVGLRYSRPPVALGRAPRVDVTFYLYEGDQTRVGRVEIEGLSAIDRASALATLGVLEEEALDLFAFNQGVQLLKQRLRGLGYLDSRLLNDGQPSVVRYSDGDRRADIRLEFEEGPRCRLGRVDIQGLSLTREAVVRREVTLEPGDWLEERPLAETETRLRRLGIFSSVELQILPNDEAGSDSRNLRIVILEALPGVAAVRFGLRNDLGVRVQGDAAYTNLGGRNQTVAVNLTANRRLENFRFVEALGQVAYVWPWFLGVDLTFRPTITVSASQYFTFDASNAALGLTWERRLFARAPLVASLSYSLERIRQFNVCANPDARETPYCLTPALRLTDEQNITVGSITPALRLDLRDSPLAPTRGVFAQASYEIASPAFLSQSDPYPLAFTRFQSRVDLHQPIYRSINGYLSARVGYERNLAERVVDPLTGQLNPRSGSIPLIRQFALGGVGSLRGFQEQELNRNEFSISGTLSYVNYRAQVDLPFAGPLKISPFLDAANLMRDEFSFTKELRYGTGFGFRYLTPLGPLNLDLGFKVAPRANEEQFGVYFSVGVI